MDPSSPTRTNRPLIAELGWSDFLERFTLRQGEHVALIGPTGRGKTTLALQLLPRIPYVAVMATKPRDPVLDELRDQGFRKLPSWSVPDAELTPRVTIAPPLPKGADSLPAQRDAFKGALDGIFRQGGWTVFADELRYLTHHLKLEREIELLYEQGRSLGVSMISGVQRPRNVPLLAYDQATHLFFFRNADEQSVGRLGEITGGAIDSSIVRRGIELLHSHRVLYVNPVHEELAITEVEL